MKLGVMTNPRLDPIPQIHWIGQHSFDFVDMAVEPPKADHMDVDYHGLREKLDYYNLGVIVHTSPYLPIANLHAVVRESARKEILYALDLAHDLESRLLSIHYLGSPKSFNFEDTVVLYVRLLTVLCQAAKSKGVIIALENGLAGQGEVILFREIFKRVPDARLLLDLGHTHINTSTNMAREFLDDQIIGRRLVHVHVSDNDGCSDLHLPLGSIRNGVDWKKMINVLRKHPYDGTVTLEVFSPDHDYLLASRDKFRTWWDETL